MANSASNETKANRISVLPAFALYSGRRELTTVRTTSEEHRGTALTSFKLLDWSLQCVKLRVFARRAVRGTNTRDPRGATQER
jgi:hypothetical protein